MTYAIVLFLIPVFWLLAKIFQGISIMFTAPARYQYTPPPPPRRLYR